MINLNVNQGTNQRSFTIFGTEFIYKKLALPYFERKDIKMEMNSIDI